MRQVLQLLNGSSRLQSGGDGLDKRTARPAQAGCSLSFTQVSPTYQGVPPVGTFVAMPYQRQTRRVYSIVFCAYFGVGGRRRQRRRGVGGGAGGSRDLMDYIWGSTITYYLSFSCLCSVQGLYRQKNGQLPGDICFCFVYRLT